jgi:L-ascorbate metabolism protein UlaG (beta-lactamase superfamily)
MKITRTANAGVLLELDGVSILMDGVCREVKPYPATPPEVKAELKANMPEVVAFTHAHKDHYDPGFAAEALRQNGVIFGPAECHGSMEPGQVGSVRITPLVSRHIGAAGKDTQHASFIIEGSACIWFTGDASPSQWGRLSLPKPDVLIVPYAYCNTPAAWAATKALGAKVIVLLHMPARSDDSIGLWSAVENTVGENSNLFIPAINETVEIPILCH